MEVILLEKIRNLGDLGNKVSVKAGFARNYLIPFGKAAPANKRNIEMFEARRSELEKAELQKLEAAKERAIALDILNLKIEANASEEGKLYGSIGTHEIQHAIENAGYEVERREILMPNGSIHEIGEYEIPVQVHTDVSATIRLSIVAAK